MVNWGQVRIDQNGQLGTGTLRPKWLIGTCPQLVTVQ